MQLIDIAFCTNTAYVTPTAVCITSILLSNQKEHFCFHIVYATLDKQSKVVFNKIAGKFPGRVSFCYHEVNSEMFANCPVRLHDHITIETYFRILFPVIFPETIKKILYIDGDIVCVDSIAKLYDTNIDNYSVAAVPDVYNDDIRKYNRLDLLPGSGYFNAGVLLINLEYWRKHAVQEKTFEYIYNNPERCIAHDQDALNATLSGSVLTLSCRYNLQLDFFGSKNRLLLNKIFFSDIDESLQAPVLLHFTGTEKPWHYECVYPLKKIYSYIYSVFTGKKLHKTFKYTGKKHIIWLLKKFLSFFNLDSVNKLYPEQNFASMQKNLLEKIGHNASITGSQHTIL